MKCATNDYADDDDNDGNDMLMLMMMMMIMRMMMMMLMLMMLMMMVVVVCPHCVVLDLKSLNEKYSHVSVWYTFIFSVMFFELFNVN